MKRLIKLLEKVNFEVLCGDADIEIENLVTDSRKVSKGDAFVCIHGANFDGHKFINDVIEKGAKAIILEDDSNIDLGLKELKAAIIKVEDTKLAMAHMSAAYFDYPAKKLKIIGITGTNGKTTVAYMIYSLLLKAGIKAGLIGTIETIIGEEHIPSVNTTPDSYTLQEEFAGMVKAGIEVAVMEVSSQGLKLHRVSGFTFDYGVFTNLGKDHIGGDEHKDFEDYMYCKSLLFKQCRHGIINIDDPHAKDMIRDASFEDMETFGIVNEADVRAENIKLYKDAGVLGISYELNLMGKERHNIKIGIPGRFNVYNSLTAIAVCRHFIADTKLICSALSDVKVKGRAELVPVSKDFTVMIDYAHNAMSLESLLTVLREYDPNRIISVFGCGGNRDRNRRFEMGEVSSKMSDFTIATSDNPRKENPKDILEDVITGIKRGHGEYIAIADRQEAVKYAISIAKPGDIIVLAGKGHEDYQIIGDKKYHMDERELLENARKAILGGQSL